MVPNDSTSYTLGTASKPWVELYVSDGVTHANANGNTTKLDFGTPAAGSQTYLLQDISGYGFPNNTVTVAIEGMTPSMLPFGKNGSLSATDGYPQDYEFTTINGSQNGQGWRMPSPGVVTHISFQCTVSAISNAQLDIVLVKNGSTTSHKVTLYPSSTGSTGGSLSLGMSPLYFAENDTLGLHYQSQLSSGAPGSLTTSNRACLIRFLH